MSAGNRKESSKNGIPISTLPKKLKNPTTANCGYSPNVRGLPENQAANGIIGLETAVPLTLSLFRKGYIDAAMLVELLSGNPARIMGVNGGSLGIGSSADITVIDPEQQLILQEKDILSKSKNSPFIGSRLQGRAVLTICGGRITHNVLNA